MIQNAIFCVVFLIVLGFLGVDGLADAQQICRNNSSDGSGQTICRQPDGSWAVVNPPGTITEQEPEVPPAPFSLSNLDASVQQPIPEISDCVSFGQLIKATSSDDLAEALNSYFNADLKKEPDEILNNLVDQARSCIRQRPLNEDAYVWESLTWAYHGADDIQAIENENDAAVQAAAEAKQNAIDAKRNAAMIADIPACDDPDTISNVEHAVANSPAGRTQGLELLGLKNFQDVSGPQNMGYRVCNADALFNNGERNVQYKIDWFDKSQGELVYSLSDTDTQ